MKSAGLNIKQTKTEKKNLVDKNAFDDESKGGLTIEKLKTFKGFENSTESESIEQIEIIKKLSMILYQLFVNEQMNTDQSK